MAALLPRTQLLSTGECRFGTRIRFLPLRRWIVVRLKLCLFAAVVKRLVKLIDSAISARAALMGWSGMASSSSIDLKKTGLMLRQSGVGQMM